MKTIDEKKLKENIRKRAEADFRCGKIGGAAFFVRQRNQTLCYDFYGYKTADRKSVLSEDCLFRLASMTKPIVTIAIMREVEKGNLSLFDKVETFLPEFADMSIGKVENGKVVITGKAKNSLRILHLLTHTSGLDCGELGDFLKNSISEKDNCNLDSAVLYYAKNPLAFEPYTQSQYSGTVAFDVLLRILEIVSGKTAQEYFQSEIFLPLKMTDTTFEPSPEQWDRLVEMHDYQNGASTFVKMKENCIFEDIPVTHRCGGAGLISSLGDYARFATMLLNGGELDGVRILQKNTVRSFSKAHIPESLISCNNWSLGMRVIEYDDYDPLASGSYGWSGSYGTHFWVDPVNKVAAVYMKNSMYEGGAGARTAVNFEKDVFDSYKEK